MPGAPDMKPPVRRRRNGVASIQVGDVPGPAAAPPQEQAPRPEPAAATHGALAGGQQQDDAAGTHASPPQLPEPAPASVTASVTTALPEPEAVSTPAAEGAPAGRAPALPAEVPAPVVRQPRPAVSLPAARESRLLDELLTLGESARRSPDHWESYSPNLRGDVNDAFKVWISDYAIGTGHFGISKNHCLHAALSRMPLDERGFFDLEQVAQAGRDWLAAHPGRGAASARGGQSSVGKQLAGRLRSLAKKLPTAKPKIELWAVLSAYVSQFMADNPPPPPDLLAVRQRPHALQGHRASHPPRTPGALTPGLMAAPGSRGTRNGMRVAATVFAAPASAPRDGGRPGARAARPPGTPRNLPGCQEPPQAPGMLPRFTLRRLPSPASGPSD